MKIGMKAITLLAFIVAADRAAGNTIRAAKETNQDDVDRNLGIRSFTGNVAGNAAGNVAGNPGSIASENHHDSEGPIGVNTFACGPGQNCDADTEWCYNSMCYPKKDDDDGCLYNGECMSGICSSGACQPIVCVKVTETESKGTSTYDIARVEARCPSGYYVVRHKCESSNSKFHYAEKDGDDGYSNYIMRRDRTQDGYTGVISIEGVSCEYYHTETGAFWTHVSMSTEITATVTCAEISEATDDVDTVLDAGFTRQIDFNSGANLPDQMLYDYTLNSKSFAKAEVVISGADRNGNGNYNADQFKCDLTNAYTDYDSYGNLVYRGEGWMEDEGRPEFVSFYCRPDANRGPYRMPEHGDFTIYRSDVLNEVSCRI